MTQDQIRAALDRLESRMDIRLSRIEAKLDDQLPRVAVLESKVDDQETKSSRTWQSWLAISAALLACVGTVAQALIGG